MRPTRAILEAVARLEAEGRVTERGRATPDPAPPAADTSEAEFTEAVIAYARGRGFLVAHFRPARTAMGWRTAVAGDGAGFPDLLMVRDGQLIVAELKAARGRLTAKQRLWLAAFKLAGVPTFVWKPIHWPVIVETLK